MSYSRLFGLLTFLLMLALPFVFRVSRVAGEPGSPAAAHQQNLPVVARAMATATGTPTQSGNPTPAPTQGGNGPAPGARWQPTLADTWQIQLSSQPIVLSVNATVFDIDLVDTPAATVAALHARNKRAVCYISAGSYEDWRPDAGKYPAAVLGNPLDGWPGERWLDIRQLSALAPILEARLDLCRAKGFDGVEFDNVDGYTNNTGFPLTGADQLAFNRYLAEAAHTRGLAVGLKNDLAQVAALVGSFDFAVNEQCFQYRECDLLKPFIAAGKPVFQVEYNLAIAAFCPQANALGFSSIKKSLNLGPALESCR